MYGNNTAKAILEIIKALLSTELGTFANGQTSICVIPPSAPKKGNGLHVKIEFTPRQLTAEKYEWRVLLTQYDRTTAGMAKYENALKKIRGKFPVHRSTTSYAQESNDEFPATVFYLRFDRSAYINMDLVS